MCGGDVEVSSQMKQLVMFMLLTQAGINAEQLFLTEIATQNIFTSVIGGRVPNMAGRDPFPFNSFSVHKSIDLRANYFIRRSSDRLSVDKT
jgi:hypothetical protein